MLDAENFRLHIIMQDRESKVARANHLYGNYTFDTALPHDWVDSVVKKTIYTHEQVVSQFVWLYFNHNACGQPAPLTLEGCDILEAYNKTIQ